MVHARTPRLSDTGTSLMELVVVMAIVGILAIVGTPLLLSYWRAATLDGGARELQTILNDARQRAIKENRFVRVTTDGVRVQQQWSARQAGPWTNWVGPGTDSNGWIGLDNNVQITNATANVIFTYLGSAVPAGTYTVRNPVDGQTTRVCVAASGRIRLHTAADPCP